MFRELLLRLWPAAFAAALVAVVAVDPHVDKRPLGVLTLVTAVAAFVAAVAEAAAPWRIRLRVARLAFTCAGCAWFALLAVETARPALAFVWAACGFGALVAHLLSAYTASTLAARRALRGSQK